MAEYSQAVNTLYEKLSRDAEEMGYHLNPDPDFTLMLCEGLEANQQRYGYPLCPCRLGTGVAEADLDIVCPCDYRDPDLDDYGCCYCSLYVSQEVLEGKAEASSIPDRRPPERVGSTEPATPATPGETAPGEAEAQPARATTYPVWRCKVCGYLCARDKPPGVCPICKATRERFEPFPL